jgi:hypothetical protein
MYAKRITKIVKIGFERQRGQERVIGGLIELKNFIYMYENVMMTLLLQLIYSIKIEINKICM